MIHDIWEISLDSQIFLFNIFYISSYFDIPKNMNVIFW